MNETYDDPFATLTEMLNQNKKEQMIDELLGDTPVNPLAGRPHALRYRHPTTSIMGKSATAVWMDDPWDI